MAARRDRRLHPPRCGTPQDVGDYLRNVGLDRISELDFDPFGRSS
jgi:hypothetical protein